MKKYLVSVMFMFMVWPSIHAYQLGIDQVARHDVQKAAHCNEPRIGLLTNHTGRDRNGRSTVDILRSRGLLIQRLFVPEHGLDGTVPASHGVATMHDKRTGLEVVGLMKHDGSLGEISPAKLADIDLLMVDLQDVGMRHFTYSGFLYYFMEVAARTKKPLVVLDRPNPLGSSVEGPVVKRIENSLIARASVPLRHGLTMGELAHFYNATYLSRAVRLTVVPLKDYVRTDRVDDTLLANISPNVCHKQAVYTYSFLGALGEIRPFDCGIGTEYAMQVCALSLTVMPDESFWTRLATKLTEWGLETKVCSYWSPRKKGWCRGLQFIDRDVPPLRTFNVLLTIVDSARRAGVTLSFAPFFERALGDPLVTRYLKGSLSLSDLAQTVNKQLARYYEKVQPALLYKPGLVVQKL